MRTFTALVVRLKEEPHDSQQFLHLKTVRGSRIRNRT